MKVIIDISNFLHSVFKMKWKDDCKKKGVLSKDWEEFLKRL